MQVKEELSWLYPETPCLHLSSCVMCRRVCFNHMTNTNSKSSLISVRLREQHNHRMMVCQYYNSIMFLFRSSWDIIQLLTFRRDNNFIQTNESVNSLLELLTIESNFYGTHLIVLGDLALGWNVKIFCREKIYTVEQSIPELFCLENPVVSSSSLVFVLNKPNSNDDEWRGSLQCEEGVLF